jgi:hypothetical protein
MILVYIARYIFYFLFLQLTCNAVQVYRRRPCDVLASFRQASSLQQQVLFTPASCHNLVRTMRQRVNRCNSIFRWPLRSTIYVTNNVISAQSTKIWAVWTTYYPTKLVHSNKVIIVIFKRENRSIKLYK